MIKIAICDDEPGYVDRIAFIIETHFEEVRIDKYVDSSQLIRGMSNQYDVAFLDIDMPDYSGFDLAGRLVEQNKDICVVFISNMEEKVYESFRYQPLRFIRKSRLEEEIPEAVETIKKKFQNQNSYYEFVDTNKQVKKTKIQDIMYFESNRHYINVICTRERFVIREKVSQLESEFGIYDFVRVQIGYLVNMRYIKSISGSTVVLDNGVSLSIGRNSLQHVREQYMEYARKAYDRKR